MCGIVHSESSGSMGKNRKGQNVFFKFKPQKYLQIKKMNKCYKYFEVLKCEVCASWVVSKVLALFSIFFCKQKKHSDSRASLAELKRKLEKYIEKLRTTIVDSNIQFAVHFMLSSGSSLELSQGKEVFFSCTYN